jgi:hypothetical protein
LHFQTTHRDTPPGPRQSQSEIVEEYFEELLYPNRPPLELMVGAPLLVRSITAGLDSFGVAIIRRIILLRFLLFFLLHFEETVPVDKCLTVSGGADRGISEV